MTRRMVRFWDEYRCVGWSAECDPCPPLSITGADRQTMYGYRGRQIDGSIDTYVYVLQRECRPTGMLAVGPPPTNQQHTHTYIQHAALPRLPLASASSLHIVINPLCCAAQCRIIIITTICWGKSSIIITNTRGSTCSLEICAPPRRSWDTVLTLALLFGLPATSVL
jgi:hypothetical protein